MEKHIYSINFSEGSDSAHGYQNIKVVTKGNQSKNGVNTDIKLNFRLRR
jgi:hypothetical protein